MRIILQIIALLAVVFLPLQAHARNHGSVYRELADETGVIVQPLMHGQMQLMYDHHGAILALARKHADDPVMSHLLDFEFKQRAMALFGLLPASVSDANQWLHKPTHGYLAPTRAMLERMTQISPAVGSPERTLFDRIENDAIFNYEDPTSIMTCEYSDLTFVTTQWYGPDWSKLASSSFFATLAMAFGVLSALMLAALSLRQLRRPQLTPTF